MARGWESKSVEEQQSQVTASHSGQRQPLLTPDEKLRQRQVQGLQLSRQRVLQQLAAAQSERHRELLRAALADLDSRLAQLG